MATAQVTYTATGSVDTWAFSFSYLNTDHVKLYLDGVEDTSATFPTASSITASAGNPASGVVVLIIRETPRTSLLTTISNSGSIRNSDLNNQALQALYVAEEARDKLDGVMSLSADETYWDASVSAVNKLISNVVDPVGAQDAATKNYVDTGADSQVAAAAASAAAALSSENNAATSETNASGSAASAATEVTYAAQWADKAEDSLIDVAAGGDGSTDYSALHHAAKASASASAASTSESNASTSASNASTSASNAATSESNAATSASNASTSATNASNAQTAAEAAQTAAELAADNFDDTYLGAKAADPTLDNDGDALTTGDLYFNTGTNDLKVYNGSAWEVAATSVVGLPTLAGTNAFTGANSFTQDVGIGISSPDGKLHVHEASAGTVTAASPADDLTVENSTDAGISILTPATSTGSIYFGDPAGSTQGRVTYNHNTDVLGLYTGAVVAISMDSNQTATVKGVKTVADDDGNQSSGTYTPSPDGGNIKRITNTGTFAIGPPSENGTMVLEMYNDTGAGTVTFSAFTYTDGDSFTTTVGHWFLIYITRCGSTAYANVKALQ